LRIISGKYKGRRINPQQKLTIRPTTDIAKEGLFNILDNHFEFDGLEVIDLFSGSGSIAVEFASRGCKSVVAVEINPRCYESILNIKKQINIEELHPVKANVFNYLKSVNRKFDIIFADPPYDNENIETLPQLIFERELLNPGMWLIIEHSEANNFSKHPNFLQVRKYGKVNFSIFENNEK